MARWYPSMVAVLLAALVLSITPQGARAQYGKIWITASGIGPTADHQASTPCSNPANVLKLYVAIEPSIDIPDFRYFDLGLRVLGIAPVLFCGPGDYSEPLKPFWIYDDVFGSCNTQGYSVGVDPPENLYGAGNLWAGSVPTEQHASLQASANEERVALSLTRDTPIPLVAHQRYYAMTLNLPMCSAQLCQGCDQSVAIALLLTDWQGSVEHDYALNFEGGDFLINNQGVCAVAPPPSGDPRALFAKMRSAAKSSNQALSVCDAVPVVRHTWGTLKLLYRCDESTRRRLV